MTGVCPVCGTLALFLGRTSGETLVYSSGSGAFLGETSKHVIQLSLPYPGFVWHGCSNKDIAVPRRAPRAVFDDGL